MLAGWKMRQENQKTTRPVALVTAGTLSRRKDNARAPVWVPLGSRAAAEAGGLHGGEGDRGELHLHRHTTPTQWLLRKIEPSKGFERAPSSQGARSCRRSTSLGVSRATFPAIPLPVSPVPGLAPFPPAPVTATPQPGPGSGVGTRRWPIPLPPPPRQL